MRRIWESALRDVQALVCAFSGLKPLQDFRISYLLSNPFKRRSRSEIDAYLNCGCPQTTPSLVALSSDWPRPWFFWRMLLFGFLVVLIFFVGVQVFLNLNMFPGLIVAGAFFVPLACVALFFELNVVRDISLYQVLKLIVGGGAVSLVFVLFLNKATELERLLGAMSAGIVEEIAKVLVAVFVAVALVRGTQQSKWILHGLLVGAAVGAGFAGFESAGYAFKAFLEDLGNFLAGHDHGFTNVYRTLVLRGLFAPFCHVPWTASVVGALWRVKKDQPFRFSMLFHKDFLRVLAFVVLLHMLWNSRLLWMTRYPNLAAYLWLMSVVGIWYLVLLLVQEGLWQVRDAKSVAASESKASLFADKIESLHLPKEAVVRKWLIFLGTLLLTAAFWFGAFVVKNVRDQAAKRRAAETKQDWSAKNAPKPDSTLVALAGDLAPITIFNIGTSSGPQWVSQIWGTVRNDLPQPVEKVQLKALIYDTAGRLIASQTFALPNSRLDPGVPIIFNQVVALNNLPFGYQCWVQVIQAHYVQPVSAPTAASTQPSQVSLTPPPGDHMDTDLGLMLALIVVPAIGVLAIALTIFLTIRSKPLPPKPPPLPDAAAKSH